MPDEQCWMIEEVADCYNESWRDVIVPEAFAHPAKMSRGLLKKIYDRLFEMGALNRGSVVVDPFGGIGTTAIEGAYRGCYVLCCELEPKFFALAEQNFDQHARDWSELGCPIPVIVNGDSRKLRANLAEALEDVAAVIGSPPFQSSLMRAGEWDRSLDPSANSHPQNRSEAYVDRMRSTENYGQTDGQLASMKPGEVDAVISSPPYAEISSGAGGLNTKPPKHEGQQGGRSGEAASQDTDQRYGETEGQLARLPKGDVEAVIIIDEPVLSETGVAVKSTPVEGVRSIKAEIVTVEACLECDGRGEYLDATGNVLDGGTYMATCHVCRGAGRVTKIDAIVSSPPFLDARSGTTNSIKGGTPTRHDPEEMGRSEGNLNQMKPGAVDAVVSSPPFSQGYAGGGGINKRGYSPDGGEGADKVGERSYQALGAEREPGNLETMEFDSVDAVLSSPPYEGSVNNASDPDKSLARLQQKVREGKVATHSRDARYILRKTERNHGSQIGNQMTYGTTDGQIGAEVGETFWHAAADIVRESYALLKPGGVAVWVVKAFVRNGKIVDFPGDWRKLCEHVGFETMTEMRAMLVSETTHNTLFDGEVTKRRERKSFFRRLAEKKGSPRIDWEVVWFMRKPL